MPTYQVWHSYPLTREQKAQLAKAITELHATAFTTPSIYVNVCFKAAEPSGDFFVGGEPKEYTPNRINGYVRVGPTRTKEMFDKLGRSIYKAWNEIVSFDETLHPVTDEDRRKILRNMNFTPVHSGTEDGILLPVSGKEGEWLKENMPIFRERADIGGDKDYINLLKEIEEREDLQALFGSNPRSV